MANDSNTHTHAKSKGKAPETEWIHGINIARLNKQSFTLCAVPFQYSKSKIWILKLGNDLYSLERNK